MADQDTKAPAKKEYYKSCVDCGKFLPKDWWIPKDSDRALMRGARPLCNNCAADYDDVCY